MEPHEETRCGTVVLAGPPNAGKSTLLNALVGARLAITSHRPQSSRVPVIGIRTDERVQFVFIDPPGLLDPRYLLQRTMVHEAIEAVRRADVVLHLHRASEAPAPRLDTLVPSEVIEGKPVLTVLTAIDEVVPQDRTDGGSPARAVSAVTGEGIAGLLQWCREHLPRGPFRYDIDDMSTQPVRFFVEEAVREAAFEIMHQELPYAIATHVEEYREHTDPVLIRVTMYVERESQKGILIGSGGRTLKRIGAVARARIEDLIDGHVYLDLWVKVLPRWRKSPTLLQQLGFRVPPSRKR